MSYLYEVKVVDKDGDMATGYDIVATDMEHALFKANDLVDSDLGLDESLRPYRIAEIKEDRIIDSL